MSGALFDRIIGGCTGDSNAEELQADLLKYRRARSLAYVEGDPIEFQFFSSVSVLFSFSFCSVSVSVSVQFD